MSSLFKKFSDLKKDWFEPSGKKSGERSSRPLFGVDAIKKPTVDAIPFAMEVDSKGLPQPVYLNPQSHTLVVGTTGGGKSGTTNAILSMLAAIGPDNPDGTNADGSMYRGGYVAIIGVDLKGGIELAPWLPRLSFLATEPNELDFLLDKLLEENERRQKFLRTIGKKKINPQNKKYPLIVVIIDELAQATAGGISGPPKGEEVVDYEIPQSDKDRQTKLWKLSAVGRSQGIFLICATQRPSANLIPTDFRSNFDQRLAHRVNDATDTEICMGRGLAANAPAHTLPKMPGLMYAKIASRPEPIMCRSFYVDEDDCRPIALENASKRYIIPWLKMPGKLYRGSVMEEFYQHEYKKNNDVNKYSNVFSTDDKAKSEKADEPDEDNQEAIFEDASVEADDVYEPIFEESASDEDFEPEPAEDFYKSFQDLLEEYPEEDLEDDEIFELDLDELIREGKAFYYTPPEDEPDIKGDEDVKILVALPPASRDEEPADEPAVSEEVDTDDGSPVDDITMDEESHFDPEEFAAIFQDDEEDEVSPSMEYEEFDLGPMEEFFGDVKTTTPSDTEDYDDDEDEDGEYEWIEPIENPPF